MYYSKGLWYTTAHLGISTKVLKIVLNLAGPLEIESRKILYCLSRAILPKLAFPSIIRTILNIKKRNYIQKQCEINKTKNDRVYIFLSLSFNYLVKSSICQLKYYHFKYYILIDRVIKCQAVKSPDISF